MQSKMLPYMKLQGEQRFQTENYVAIPPALIILDEMGAVWTLGLIRGHDGPQGEYSFNVVRDGVDTGEFASRVERRGGRVRIFTRTGWKRWTGHTFI